MFKKFTLAGAGAGGWDVKLLKVELAGQLNVNDLNDPYNL